MSPLRFTMAMKQWNSDMLDTIKSNWERTRLNIYFTVQMKNPVPYKQFCIQYMPFTWDQTEPVLEITEDIKKQIFDEDYFMRTGTFTSETVDDLSKLSDLIS